MRHSIMRRSKNTVSCDTCRKRKVSFIFLKPTISIIEEYFSDIISQNATGHHLVPFVRSWVQHVIFNKAESLAARAQRIQIFQRCHKFPIFQQRG